MNPQVLSDQDANTIVSALHAVGEHELAATFQTLRSDTAGGSFKLDMLLNLLGVQGADRDTVKNAIPAAQNMVALLNNNRNVIAQIATDWQTVGPAAQIIFSKLG